MGKQRPFKLFCRACKWTKSTLQREHVAPLYEEHKRKCPEKGSARILVDGVGWTPRADEVT